MGVGTWERIQKGRSAGSAYSFSASVKIFSFLGFNLGIKRPYASSATMSYVIGPSGNHQMCGKDNDPFYASKVRERLVP